MPQTSLSTPTPAAQLSESPAAKELKSVSPFVRVTPTARNSPPYVLLNAHHVDRLQQDSRGLVIILKGADAAEHIPVSESSHTIADAIKADVKPGRITVHECIENRPLHSTSFDLADIRAIEPSDPGSLIRHGLDGSGHFEAFEDFETLAHMIDTADA
jgi:hypothetical protein